jgi:flagellar motor switch protein FliG
MTSSPAAPAALDGSDTSLSRTPLTGEKKCAIVVLALGADTGSKILRSLAEEEVEIVSREITRLPTIPPLQVQQILDEFYQTMLAQQYMVEGGITYTRRLLADAFGEESSRTIIERVLKSMGADAATFDQLQKVDPRQLAKLVYAEHPQIIALVLSRLVPAQAAALLQALPPELRPDVVKRVASLDQLSPEIIARIAAFIDRRLKSLGEFSRQSYGGVRAVAEILNRLDRSSSDELLHAVEDGESNLADTIRKLMFVFEDIVTIDRHGMSALTSEVERSIIALALKGSSPKIVSHFTQCLSQRSGEMLVEDIEALGPVKIRDVENAQQKIIATLRVLQSKGVISSDDKYIG